MLHFYVGKGSMAPRAPVNDIISLIDEPFFIESNKDLPYSPGKALIHGKPLSGPITGAT